MGNGKNIQLIKYCKEDNSFSRMVIDRNGIKWLGTNRDGVNGFDDNGTIFKKSLLDQIRKPTAPVAMIQNQLWRQNRVLTNVGSFQNEEQLATRAIIIMMTLRKNCF
jgi:hypothetical protein